jgi:hypothetical protein
MMQPVPMVAQIKQTFDPDCVDDLRSVVHAELERIGIDQKVKPGQHVAIAAGSRGIANIIELTRALVDFIKSCGAIPFIFPSMGSHGGATAEGQLAVLDRIGINESSMGCAIRSTMDTVEIGTTQDHLPVFIDRYAWEADCVMVVNRIKPHTKFEGSIESGLVKMMAIGMGKHKGAKNCHQASVRLGMGRVIETVGAKIIAKLPILCGVGIVENGYDQIAIVRAMAADAIFEGEKELLVHARQKMARIPFADIDLLIVDEMGKDISGTGMDTNVTGVNRDILGGFCAEPRTKRLFVRDLTHDTNGNALGIGLADFTTTRLVEKIDRKKTYVNCLTGISPEKGAIPMYFDTDRECIEAAIQSLGIASIDTLRMVHIQNTRSLEKLIVSQAYKDEIDKNESLTMISDWHPLPFDTTGNMIALARQ